MSSATTNPAAPNGKTPQRGRARVLAAWCALFLVLAMLWLALITVLRPGAGTQQPLSTLMFNLVPPALSTLLCWVIARCVCSPVAAATPSLTPAAVSPQQEARRLVQFRIGAWAVLTPHGDAAATLAGVKAQKAAFALDRRICHPDGSPVHAGVVKDLDVQKPGSKSDARDPVARVGALLKTVLDDLHIQQLALTKEVEGKPLVFCMASSAVLERDPTLDFVRKAWAASAWSNEQCDVRPLANQPLALSTLLGALQRQDVADVGSYVVILAADSILHADELAPFLATGQIFSGSHPQGWIPSEGAAGYLLIDPERCPESLWRTSPLLGPVAASNAAAPANQPAHHSVTSALKNAVMAAKCEASGVGALFNDGDHRGSASAAIVQAMQDTLPHLEPMKHRMAPMEFAGMLGAATETINFALAAEHCCTDDVIAATVHRDMQRAMAAITTPASD